jgi:hypothetical protein
VSEDFVVLAEARNFHQCPALALDVVALVAETTDQFIDVLALVLEVDSRSVLFDFFNLVFFFIFISFVGLLGLILAFLLLFFQ